MKRDFRSLGPRQVFEDLPDETEQFFHACGEDADILENFMYVGSIVPNNGKSHQEVLWWTGLAHDVFDSLSITTVNTCTEGQRSGSSSHYGCER